MSYSQIIGTKALGEVDPILDVSDDATGEWFFPRALSRAYHIIITGTATVELEATMNDGVDVWMFHTTDISEMVTTAEPLPQIRAVASGMSGGTAKVLLAV